MDALPNQSVPAQVRLIKAIGELKYLPALASITTFTSNNNVLLKKQALWTVALLADASSYQVLLQEAKMLISRMIQRKQLLPWLNICTR
ncbi:MAG: hypothetical protein IPJ20_20215 [Flammeovirgaceae bacterium]|nr:hypothetical protein [Flammeovirgaceae bacterium]